MADIEEYTNKDGTSRTRSIRGSILHIPKEMLQGNGVRLNDS